MSSLKSINLFHNWSTHSFFLPETLSVLLGTKNLPRGIKRWNGIFSVPFKRIARIVDLNFIGHENEQMTRNGTFLKNLQIPAAPCSRGSIQKSNDSNGSWIETWPGYYHVQLSFFSFSNALLLLHSCFRPRQTQASLKVFSGSEMVSCRLKRSPEEK